MKLPRSICELLVVVQGRSKYSKARAKSNDVELCFLQQKKHIDQIDNNTGIRKNLSMSERKSNMKALYQREAYLP